jgi:hypothetical protein
MPSRNLIIEGELFLPASSITCSIVLDNFTPISCDVICVLFLRADWSTRHASSPLIADKSSFLVFPLSTNQIFKRKLPQQEIHQTWNTPFLITLLTVFITLHKHFQVFLENSITRFTRHANHFLCSEEVISNFIMTFGTIKPSSTATRLNKNLKRKKVEEMNKRHRIQNTFC